MQSFLNDLGSQLGIVVGISFLLLAGPFTALLLISHRKRRERRLRRSALALNLLRAPGQTLREQIDDCRLDLFGDVMLLSWIPLMLLAFDLAQRAFGRGLQTSFGAALYVVIGLIAAAVLLRRIWRTSQRLDRLRAGHDAETAVGQELHQLMRSGAYVFHDVPADGFNIDHVVVASEGVFAIETKGYSKPNRGLGKADATVKFDGQTLAFPTWTSKAPIEQAERQANWLGRWLSDATAQPVQALPIVALPGWFIERTGRGNVRLFSGRELASLLKARGTQPIDGQEVDRIAHQLELRCRTVEPMLRQSLGA